jgi:xanthine dehydrogenase YagR molybdenum-binding subunit
MITLPKTLKKPSPLIGASISRVDGPLKVTGAAKYAGEFAAPNLTYGYVVESTIAVGRIKSIDTKAALAVDGVLEVFTHENRPRTAWFDKKWKDDDALPGSPFRPLYDDKVVYNSQPVALVVAETFEAARYAATLVKVEYAADAHQTDLRAARDSGREPRKGKGGFQPPPKPRGDVDAGLAAGAHRIGAEYFQPTEHHNPMEMHASTVVFEEDESLTIYDKTQGCQNSQKYVSNVFGLPAAKVRVISPFLGGGFGAGLRPQYQLFLAVMAAIELKRSVRVTLTRQQMFSFGHRPETIQTIHAAADSAGKLTAIKHDAVAETSRFEDYCEVVVNWSGQQYQCDNVKLDYKVAPTDVYSPLDMRAPGAVTGQWALESAIDELAYAAGIDPVEFRLLNYAEQDQNAGKPFSSKELRACYRQGAERFGWSERTPAPRSMRDGRYLIGQGVASGAWDAMQNPASARARFTADGKLIVSSATAEIGTGTYTVMALIAAATLGLAIEDVTFRLGDSTQPTSPLAGGSWTVSSVGSAVKAVCDKIGAELFALARKVPDSPLKHVDLEATTFADGAIHVTADPSKRVTFAEAMRHGKTPMIEQSVTAVPNLLKQAGYTRGTHSAVFVEVRVDPDLGTIGVSRVVSAIAAGRIISGKTARSQILGAVVMGIGMAMQEETVMDDHFGRYMNHNLAEYHVPIAADVNDIDVIFVEEHDEIVNPLGAKGVGEIGIVGVAAAIANAVYHATGRRVRDLPITLDKLL